MVAILHIDTSVRNIRVTLAIEGHVKSKRIAAASGDAASLINTFITEVLFEGGIRWEQLSALAVIGGPGSYTGLRIGLATAKGVCYALEKPLLMHNKLDILALQVGDQFGQKFSYYVAILPARTHEYFMSVFDNAGNNVFPARHLYEEEIPFFLEQMEGTFYIVGCPPGQIKSLATYNIVENETQIDDSFWAVRALMSYNCKSFADLSLAEPFYLKQVLTHK